MELTALQSRILAYITEHIRGHGYPPTVREIGRHCRITSPSSVAYHLKVLGSKGLLKRRGSLSRGIELTEDPNRQPVLGRVGAGSGIIAQEDVEDRVAVDPDFMAKSDFLLRVRGDSMDRAGILEGDYVQVRRRDTAEDGEIVVAIVGEEEGVVKTLRKSEQRWTLESANPAYPPITDPFQIVGVVVGLVRRYGR